MKKSTLRIVRCLSTAARSRVFAILVATSVPAGAQQLATLEVRLDQPTAGLAIPVQVALDPITHLHDSSLSLLQIQGKNKIPVAFQVEANPDRKLTWLVNGNTALRFELIRNGSTQKNAPAVTADKKDGGLILKAGNTNLLRFQFENLQPPKGVNPVFTRNAFIHPLWTPHGQVLTRIQPPDHYHHYGLWNPWTRVLFEGDTVDFWNLHARQGTVRFSDFISVISGNIFGQYAALHEHVAFAKNGEEKIAMREVQTVRVYAPTDADYYTADITVQLNCPGAAVRLLTYRYGGLGWRATEQWTKENSRVLSSEGRTRKDADGSKARWCIIEGTVDGENAGAVMMSYPANYNHPEPLRIWPEDANGNRGDMFTNFSPTKDKDWPLKPGQNYILKYRLIVFNGSFTKEKAEAAWHYFASPPAVTVTKTN